MILKAMSFSITACILTYGLILHHQPHFYKVDLKTLLNVKAAQIAKRHVNNEDLEKELLIAKKEMIKKLTIFAHKKKAIFIASPAFGDIKDITSDVLKLMEMDE